MIVLYPGWCLVLWIISTVLLWCFLYDEKPFLTSVFICITLLFMFLFFSGLNKFFIYKEHEPVEISKPCNDTIKVETIKIIEERDRNLFTGKWGDESTASFKEKIINIRYEQNQNLKGEKK